MEQNKVEGEAWHERSASLLGTFGGPALTRGGGHRGLHGWNIKPRSTLKIQR